MGRLWNLIRSRQEVRSNLLLTAVLASTAVVAFCWGRHGTVSQAHAQGVGAAPGAAIDPKSDYGRRVVAFIHGNIPITREELGEYLIARFGPERVDFLVNRRIIEYACRSRNINVSDAEVDAHLKEDLKSFGDGMTEKKFVDEVLKRYNKTLYEWREDVIRPRLALTKFCQGKITVTDADTQKRFEQLYGDKVECRMILMPAGTNPKDALAIWSKVKNDAAAFDEAAKNQAIPQLRMRAGAFPPIHKYFDETDKENRLERAAFSLKDGQISDVLDMPDKSMVILRRIKAIPPDTTKKLADERLKLNKEVYDIKLSQEIPKIFADLRAAAQPNILMKRELTPAEQDRHVQQQLHGQPGMAVPTMSAPRGN